MKKLTDKYRMIYKVRGEPYRETIPKTYGATDGLIVFSIMGHPMWGRDIPGPTSVSGPYQLGPESHEPVHPLTAIHVISACLEYLKKPAMPESLGEAVKKMETIIRELATGVKE